MQPHAGSLQAAVSQHDPRTPARRALAAWALLALAFAAAGGTAAMPRPAIPLAIWTPVVACVIAYRRGGSLRALVDAMDLRALILPHAARVVFGALFLVESAAGRLSPAFANVAGPGDIAAGLLALPVAWIALRPNRFARVATLAWNAFGLADILLVFATAQKLMFLDDDHALQARFGQLPYAALPVLVVPLVIATHLAVFARLRRDLAKGHGRWQRSRA